MVLKKIKLNNYRQEIYEQRKIWEKKKILRKIYFDWYRKIVSNLAPGKMNIEIGSGSGNFKSFYPQVITTDVFHTPFVEIIVDANSLPFGKERVDNFILFDVIHHLRYPLNFFREARRTIRKNGRIILIEPYISFFSYFVYNYLHHEKLNMKQNLFNTKTEIKVYNGSFSNEAIPTILFKKKLEFFKEMFSDFKVVKREFFSFLIYPLSGGFHYPSVIPHSCYNFLNNIEKAFLKPFAKFLAMRMLVVIEKS